MWGRRYFAGRFFAARYWAQSQATEPEPPPASDTALQRNTTP